MRFLTTNSYVYFTRKQQELIQAAISWLLGLPFFMILLKALNLRMIKIMKFGLLLNKKRKVEWM